MGSGKVRGQQVDEDAAVRLEAADLLAVRHRLGAPQGTTVRVIIVSSVLVTGAAPGTWIDGVDGLHLAYVYVVCTHMMS